VATLPRLVERTAVVVRSYVESKEIPDAAEVATILQAVREQIRRVYPDVRFSFEELQAIVLGKKVPWSLAQKAIPRSVFTNNVRVLVEEKDMEPIKPEASLLFLSTIAHQLEDEKNTPWVRTLCEFVDRPLQGALKQTGDALEWCLEWWIRMRISVMLGEDDDNFSLLDLLGLNQLSNRDIKRLSRRLLDGVTVTSDTFIAQTLSASSRLGAGVNPSFFKAIDKLMSEHPGRQLFVLRSAKGDAFDLLLIVRTKDKRGPLFAFLECKERNPRLDIDKDAGPVNILDNPRLPWDQAIHVLGMCEETKLDDSSVTLDALTSGRFIFIYWTTHRGTSFAKPAEELPSGRKLTRHEHVIRLFHDDSKVFFGPAFGILQSIAASATV